jgi:hypothetical protein
MGLDIRSYSNLKKGKETGDSVYIGKGPKHVARHEYTEGWYEPTLETEGHGFKAGSYGGYNIFRGHLCAAIHGVECEEFWTNEDYEGTPFYELIDFSDCEGVIGVEESKKLHAEFMLHKHIFKKYIEEQVSSKLMIEDYMELYDDWTKAFSISAQGGALFFG